MSVSFSSGKNFTVGSGPSSIVVKDLNGDGKLDLAVANFTSNNVSVLLNDGNDGFGTPTNFTVGTNPVFLASEDIDGDDNLDLVVANADDNNVSLLLNDGKGGFGTPTNFTVGAHPSAIALADIDGDSKLDLVVANADDDNVSVLLNDSNGGFGTPSNFTVGGNPAAIALGDIDGDGNLDLVVANADDDNVSLLLGDGNGNFGTATNFTVGTYPSAIALGDIDGDSNLDLVVANYGSSNVSVLLNDGNGSFGAAKDFTVGASPNSVVLEDIDGDGKLDLVVAKDTNTKNVSVLLNDGKGGFGTATDFTVETSAAYAAVGDLNGDEKPDLLVANADSDKVSVLFYNSAPTDLMLEAIADDNDDEKAICMFSTTDPDKNDQHTYSLVAGTGDTDNDAFTIEGDSLKIKSDITKSTYNIRVRTTDSGGLSFDKELAINVNELGLAATNQITTIVNFINITENIFTVKSKVKGGKAKLSIKIESSTSKVVNEIGIFIVDDAQGTIDGIAPGAAGYAEAALKRSKIVCSALANAPTGFNPADLPSLLEFDSGANLRFYMVRNSTTDAVISGKTSLSDVVFSSATNVKVEGSETEGFALIWKGVSAGGSDLKIKIKETNEKIPPGIGLQGKHQGELIDLREVKTQVKAEFIVNREASYDNLVGFCKVNDENGGIDSDGDGTVDIRPGDPGYLKAMIRSRVEGIDLKVNNQGTATFSGNFESSSLFAPFILVNTTVEAILSSNSDDLAVFSPFLGANSGKNNHVRLLGNNCFGFEDMKGGGDRDYNDLIVQVKLTVNT
ncbi:VCBS repeat-containing protein [Nostocaceae cyanobacterium CENA369]|uniref:VCBS repeat-containing protein n=1 Tax=Dendronalium phyllosphericum CENA369 TaxID=1725256 RepID=A0A8J7I535_9NOST|nr:FG-GAP-like repeat-containing protein [Dendronalium phyllosphericum]MBH8576030.1 VCBS repeat-containing protein [Dendronalium phyllosphericum CENA369]